MLSSEIVSIPEQYVIEVPSVGGTDKASYVLK